MDGGWVGATGCPQIVPRAPIPLPPRSKAPTFAACKLLIHNERWAGVPFVLRAGKVAAGGSLVFWGGLGLWGLHCKDCGRVRAAE